MEIDRGEVVVVIGPSGSGKSTFLRCLNLLEIPTDGDILFHGQVDFKKRYEDSISIVKNSEWCFSCLTCLKI